MQRSNISLVQNKSCKNTRAVQQSGQALLGFNENSDVVTILVIADSPLHEAVVVAGVERLLKPTWTDKVRKLLRSR